MSLHVALLKQLASWRLSHPFKTPGSKLLRAPHLQKHRVTCVPVRHEDGKVRTRQAKVTSRTSALTKHDRCHRALTVTYKPRGEEEEKKRRVQRLGEEEDKKSHELPLIEVEYKKHRVERY